MPIALQSYAVLLSRPSDADQDAEMAAAAIEAVNRLHSRSTGIIFQLLDWKRDSYTDSGGEPQQLLNRQIVDDADIVLAIFREHMGTPTQRFDSGTEEEIMLALDAGKTVQVYFCSLLRGSNPAILRNMRGLSYLNLVSQSQQFTRRIQMSKSCVRR